MRCRAGLVTFRWGEGEGGGRCSDLFWETSGLRISVWAKPTQNVDKEFPLDENKVAHIYMLSAHTQSGTNLKRTNLE